jgi:hypothetical protein
MDDHQFMDEAIAELDRLRDEAQAAFIARDVPGYMRIFSLQARLLLLNKTVDILAAPLLKVLSSRYQL